MGKKTIKLSRCKFKWPSLVAGFNKISGNKVEDWMRMNRQQAFIAEQTHSSSKNDAGTQNVPFRVPTLPSNRVALVSSNVASSSGDSAFSGGVIFVPVQNLDPSTNPRSVFQHTLQQDSGNQVINLPSQSVGPADIPQSQIYLNIFGMGNVMHTVTDPSTFVNYRSPSIILHHEPQLPATSRHAPVQSTSTSVKCEQSQGPRMAQNHHAPKFRGMKSFSSTQVPFVTASRTCIKGGQQFSQAITLLNEEQSIQQHHAKNTSVTESMLSLPKIQGKGNNDTQLPSASSSGSDVSVTSESSTPKSSVSIYTPNVVMIKPPLKPQVRKVQFHQLPGLNFNRTTASQNKACSFAATESGAALSNKSVDTVEEMSGMDHCKGTISRDCNNKVNKEIETASNHGKKRKLKKESQTKTKEFCKDASVSPSYAKKGKKVLTATMADQTMAIGVHQQQMEKGNGSDEIVELTQSPIQRPLQFLTPALCLIRNELKNVSESTVFKKGVRYVADTQRTSRLRGVYVFDVYVFEKDNNSSDYPPVKIQVTDDYPAELPVFVDFQLIADSINNKKIKLRFEVAVKIFKRKTYNTVPEFKLRIPSLIFAWSEALKEMKSLPQSFFNPKIVYGLESTNINRILNL